MKALSITVAGHAASGKSAVAELIKQTLATHNIHVTLVDDNGIGCVDEAPGVIEVTLTERLAALGRAPTYVTVQTRALNRAL